MSGEVAQRGTHSTSVAKKTQNPIDRDDDEDDGYHGLILLIYLHI